MSDSIYLFKKKDILQKVSYNLTIIPGDTETLKSSVEKMIKFDTKPRNCTEEEIKNIGFKAVHCIFEDYKNHRQSPRVLAARLWRIAKIWFMVYLVIAVPLWCTRGYIKIINYTQTHTQTSIIIE